MSLQLPEGLDPAVLAHLAATGAPPGLPQGLQDDQSGGSAYGQLDCLKAVIDDFPKLLTELQDPKDVEQAVTALKILAGIQTRLMSAGQASGPPAG